MWIYEIEVNKNNAICTALALALSKNEGVKTLEKAGFDISIDRDGRSAATTIFEDQIGDRALYAMNGEGKITRTDYHCVTSRIDGPVKSAKLGTVIVE